MNKDEVLKLAKLSRIDMEDVEAFKLSTEFEAILSYVAEVKGITDLDSATVNHDKDHYVCRNTMRADDGPHESGVHTERILREAPRSEDGYIVVKNIL